MRENKIAQPMPQTVARTSCPRVGLRSLSSAFICEICGFVLLSRRFVCILALVASFIIARSTRADIDFYDSLDSAKVLADDPTKPILLQFGATWCGWCHKMDGQTFTDKKVEALAKSFTCVKIDIDEQPELAATYHVRGVPQTTVIDPAGNAIVSQAGYMPPDKLIELLNAGLTAYKAAKETAATQPDGAATQPEGATSRPAPGMPDFKTTITKMVEILSRPPRTGRDRVMTTLSKVGEKAWPVLVALLDDENLSMRAAAAHALMELTSAGLPFDPFAEPAKRQEQVAKWQAWVTEHAAKSAG